MLSLVLFVCVAVSLKFFTLAATFVCVKLSNTYLKDRTVRVSLHYQFQWRVTWHYIGGLLKWLCVAVLSIFAFSLCTTVVLHVINLYNDINEILCQCYENVPCYPSILIWKYHHLIIKASFNFFFFWCLIIVCFGSNSLIVRLSWQLNYIGRNNQCWGSTLLL